MEVTIKITNQTLYNQRVKSVNPYELVSEGDDIFNGFIQIYTNDGKIVPFYGLIEANDFEKKFGFVLHGESREVLIH